MSRALVFGAGLLLTGYDAGVAVTLCRKLGSTYFDEMIACSGSTFSASFFVANQPDVIERVWRQNIDSGQLLSPLHPLRGKKFLDLDRLVRRCQESGDRLDVEKVFASKTKLTYVLTDYHTGQSLCVRPSREDIWDLLRGSCAVTGLYGPVITKYGKVLDGGYSMLLPLKYALEQGHDEVVVVYNRPVGYSNTLLEKIARNLAGLFLPSHLRSLLYTINERRIETEKLFRDPRVKLIQASKPLPCRSMVDDNKRRLNALMDLGINDALRFVENKL